MGPESVRGSGRFGRKKKKRTLSLRSVVYWPYIFLRLQLRPTKPGTFCGCFVLHHYLAVLKGEMLIDCSVAARAVTVAADWNVAKKLIGHIPGRFPVKLVEAYVSSWFF